MTKAMISVVNVQQAAERADLYEGSLSCSGPQQHIVEFLGEVCFHEREFINLFGKV